MEPGPITIPAARLVELVNERAEAFAGLGVISLSFTLTRDCYSHSVSATVELDGTVSSVSVHTGRVFVAFDDAPVVTAEPLTGGGVMYSTRLPGADYPLRWYSQPIEHVSPVVQA